MNMLNHIVEPEDRLSDADMAILKQTLLELIQRDLETSPPGSSGEYQAVVKELISKYYHEIEEQYPLSNESISGYDIYGYNVIC